jgi:hypothetical protein
MGSTVLVVPPNDAEAILIYEIAKRMNIQVIRSAQPHGATLDKEPDIVPLVRDGGWTRAVVVEMPGPKAEARLRGLGVDVTVIDHHHYTGLNRAHDADGAPLPSSLEQFLALFGVTDAKLRSFGYSPRAARGIGVMDRGFIWALREEGYRPRDVDAVLELRHDLLSRHGMLHDERRRMSAARKAWNARKEWEGYQVVTNDTATGVREGVSFIVALEVKKPMPIIFVEKKLGLLYAQETDRAMELFRAFGGFTFGLDKNWGYRNAPGRPRVTLADVKRVLMETVDGPGKR